MTSVRELSVRGFANAAPTQYMTVGENRFAYRMFGSPSGVTLLLCQRFRGTMDDWDPLFLDTLASERRVVIFDNAGVGRSSGESPATIDGMTANAAGFIEALGLRVDVLGWSMGGAVAQMLALDYPRLVRRLIVAGSGPGGVPGRDPVPDIVMKTAAKPVNDDEDFLFLFFDGSEQRRAAGRDHLARLHRRVEPSSPLTRIETVKAMGAALRGWGSADGVFGRLAEITQPVLVANGSHDVMVPAYDSFAMAEKLADAELVLYSDAGHGFLFQHAERFGTRVNQFLDASDHPIPPT